MTGYVKVLERVVDTTDVAFVQTLAAHFRDKVPAEKAFTVLAGVVAEAHPDQLLTLWMFCKEVWGAFNDLFNDLDKEPTNG